MIARRRQQRRLFPIGVAIVMSFVACQGKAQTPPEKTPAVSGEVAPSGNAKGSLKGVEFSVRSCDHHYDWGADEEKRANKRTLVWDEGGVLSVSYIVVANCAASFGAGENTLVGVNLTLTYGIKKDPKVRAMCDCGFQLNWRIPGLTKKDYGVSTYQSWSKDVSSK